MTADQNDRNARLAEALRANLRRRKAQAREAAGKTEKPEAGQEKPVSAPGDDE